MKRMVDKELERDEKELIDLAEKFGYLDPSKTPKLRSDEDSISTIKSVGKTNFLGHSGCSSQSRSRNLMLINSSRTGERRKIKSINKTQSHAVLNNVHKFEIKESLRTPQ